MKISIITISYNAFETIEKTIVSVINQTYTNIEYIVVDGNSDDGTIQIINKYKDCIDILICEEDNGIYDAFNKGIKNATGELITFLNAGDYYDSDYCDFVISNFPKYGNFLCTNVLFYDKNNKKTLSCPSYPIVKTGVPQFLHPSLIVRSNLFVELGLFNINYRTFSDFDWMLKLINNNKTGLYINATKVYFESDGRSSKFLLKEYMTILKNNNYNFFKLIYSMFYYIFFHLKLKSKNHKNESKINNF